MPSGSDRSRQRGGRLRAPVAIALAVALVAVYFGFQHGQLTAGVSGAIEFRCNAIEYGLIPYEVTHPGAQLTDPYCQPQPDTAHEPGHDHARSDPGIVADAPTWLTPLTATVMHGGLLQLAGSLVFLLLLGPGVERRIGSLRFLGLFAGSGLLAAAAVVALSPSLPIATIGSGGAVAGVIAAHLWLVGGPRLAILAGWLLLQLAIADLDAAQPVAGAGGDVVYAVPVAVALLGLLPALRARRDPAVMDFTA